jgi:hypothetical protein
MTIAEKTQDTLSQRAIYLVLDWSALSSWKRVDVEKVSGGKKNNDDEIRARKRIVKSGALSDLRSVRYKVKKTLRIFALSSLFRPGVYAIPVDHIKTVDGILKDAQSSMTSVRERLKVEWPEIIKDAQKRLGDLFDPSDYSSDAIAASEMRMSYRYVPIAETPEILKNVAADTYKEDLERAKKETEKELESFRLHLRSALLEIIENMRRTLQKPDGDRKVFGKRFFKRLDEFLGTFAVRNLSEDGELQKVVAKLKKVAIGVDVVELKADATVQSKLDESLTGINTILKGLVEEGEGRMMDLSAE